MLSTISDRMRQYLPTCPQFLVDLTMPYAQDLIDDADYNLEGKSYYDLKGGGQFLVKRRGEFGQNLDYKWLKMVMDDGSDKLRSLFEECRSKAMNSCSYLRLLGESEVRGCLVQQTERCPNSPKTELTYEMYLKGKEICEKIEVNGSYETVEKCFQVVGKVEKLPLLSEVCTWEPPAETPAASISTGQLLRTVWGAWCLLKAIDKFRKEGTVNKVQGVALTAISLYSFYRVIV